MWRAGRSRRQAAESAPNEFVTRTGSGPLLIDEVQKAPDLFSAMKMKVDKDRREIDFILSDAGGRLLGVEVKAGSAVRSDDFRHLDWFRGKFAPDMPVIVLYTGDKILPFGRKRYAVPIAALFGC